MASARAERLLFQQDSSLLGLPCYTHTQTGSCAGSSKQHRPKVGAVWSRSWARSHEGKPRCTPFTQGLAPGLCQACKCFEFLAHRFGESGG
jgi:hypothetical protein